VPTTRLNPLRKEAVGRKNPIKGTSASRVTFVFVFLDIVNCYFLFDFLSSINEDGESNQGEENLFELIVLPEAGLMNEFVRILFYLLSSPSMFVLINQPAEFYLVIEFL
jgi:hypothetical protein